MCACWRCIMREGDIRPVKMEGGSGWLDVDRVLDIRPAASLRSGGCRTALHLQHCRCAHLFVFRGDEMVF